MRNITFVIPSMSLGGAQRVIARLANYWDSCGHRVSIVTLDDPLPSTYALAPGIRTVDVGIYAIRRRSMKGTRHIRCVLGVRKVLTRLRPDVVIAFMDGPNIFSVLALTGTRIPVIISVRVNPRHSVANAMLKRLTPYVYPRAHAIVVQTEAIKQCYGANIVRKTVVIPNPVPESEVTPANASLPERIPGRRTVVGMGRLSAQKAFDQLIRAFHSVSGAYEDWDLEILGEGEDRAALERQILELGLADRVRLPGRIETPEPWLRSADLFVLSSLFEGFPNALCEAMACGLPAISYDCEWGPSDIIRPGIDGLLVPASNESALSASMSELMGDADKRREMGERAVEVTQRFSLESIASRWEKLIDSVAR